MPSHTFTANEQWNAGVNGRVDPGYRVLSYSGSLGGGMLQVFSQPFEGVKTPVSDSKLNAAVVDGNGDAVQQLTFQTAGNVFVHLTGATAPNVIVSVE